jgi:hypothetical protein
MNPFKSIKSRYKVAQINSNNYGYLNVSGTTNQVLTGSTPLGTKGTEQGYIFAPYIMVSGTTTISEGFYESPEEKAERIREERRKKIERIFKEV